MGMVSDLTFDCKYQQTTQYVFIKSKIMKKMFYNIAPVQKIVPTL